MNNEERNDQVPDEEPPPATPDIIEKGEEDNERQEPPRATQDIMEFEGKPPKAKQDIMWKMMTPADLEESVKKIKEEEEEEEGE